MKELIQLLREKKECFSFLIEQLNRLWENPFERLKNLAQEDHLLQQALRQETFQEEDYQQEKDKDLGTTGLGEDTSSEFTAITKYSLRSIQSGRSMKSLVSSAAASSSSAYSQLDGTYSSVSLLSHRSSATAASSSSSSSSNYWRSEGENTSSSFSIQGLDHSLLSRGKLSDESYTAQSSGKTYYKRDLKPRHQKRIEKQKQKGTYYDRTEFKEEEREGGEEETSSEHDSRSTAADSLSKKKKKQRQSQSDDAATAAAYQRRQQIHQKKKELQQQAARDPYGVKQEVQYCEELLSYQHLPALVDMANELSQLLLLTATSSSSNNNTNAQRTSWCRR